jgi:hypothetical protein
MPGACPFCARPLGPQALVCGACARDVIVPGRLVAERDDLLQKCAEAQAELEAARAELAALRGPRRRLAMVRG